MRKSSKLFNNFLVPQSKIIDLIRSIFFEQGKRLVLNNQHFGMHHKKYHEVTPIKGWHAQIILFTHLELSCSALLSPENALLSYLNIFLVNWSNTIISARQPSLVLAQKSYRLFKACFIKWLNLNLILL